MEDDEFSVRFLIGGLAASYALAFGAGWAASQAFRALGWTHRIEATIVGGGASTTIHPVAAEWYGGMVGVPVLLIGVCYLFYLRPKVRRLNSVRG